MEFEGGSLRRSKHVPLRLLRDGIVLSGSLDTLYDGDVLTFHSFVDNTDCTDHLQVVLSVDLKTISQYLPLYWFRHLVSFHGIRSHGQNRFGDIPSCIRTSNVITIVHHYTCGFHAPPSEPLPIGISCPHLLPGPGPTLLNDSAPLVPFPSSLVGSLHNKTT